MATPVLQKIKVKLVLAQINIDNGIDQVNNEMSPPHSLIIGKKWVDDLIEWLDELIELGIEVK